MHIRLRLNFCFLSSNHIIQSSIYISRTIFDSNLPKNKVISTVGAGDNFSACFLYNFLHKVSIIECINRAVELSDFVVTALGAVPEYPSDLLEKISHL
jgi:sugar/nucleoside kinase (ribokinase family)